MGKTEIGMLARSKAGHDKDKVYVIIDADDAYVYLADGYGRTVDRPKKKREKHIQIICEKHNPAELDNVKIRKILKVFDEEMRGE